MKKCLVMILTALLLCGCAPEETFETVTDVPVMMPLAQPREIRVSLPGEAAMPAVESDSGRLYLCEDYEICIQTLEGGDLSTTIQTVTGYDKEALTVMERLQDDLDRYDFVWTCAGEQGDRLGRGVILDDGDYHYVMTVLRDADTTETSQIVWQDVFASFTLG